MYDLDKQTFVMLTFATVEKIHDRKAGCVTLQREAIVEVAAVKIKKGEIESHYHSFVAIDGYDARNIEFSDFDAAPTYYLNPQHLIGAPSLKAVIEKLHDYIKDAVLLVRSNAPSPYNPFTVLLDNAKSFGYLFNNPVICIGDVLTANRLQSAVLDSGVKFENLSLLRIAQMLVYEKEYWADIFADYDIIFNPDSEESYDKGRNDPLSWALAFAQFFIKLVEWGNDTAIDPLDNDCPFDV